MKFDPRRLALLHKGISVLAGRMEQFTLARTPPRRVLGADVVKKIDALLAKIDKATT